MIGRKKKPLKPLKPGMGLYQVFFWPKKAPAKSKPWAVANLQTGDVNGRWFATKAEAANQARALYAQLGDKAKVHSEEQGIIISVKEFSDPENWIDGNKKWIKMYPYSTWSHPLFTDTTITPEIADKMITNFENKVFGDKDLVIDYEHGKDPAKGGKAAGWVRSMAKHDDGIYQLVEFTDIAKSEIEAGEWRYFSGSHFDSWTHPQSGATYEYVPNGGGLTNKPYVRDGILPLNFSEVFIEKEDNPSDLLQSEGTMDTPTNEHADREHADPGQEVRLDERNDDDAANSGSRLNTPPATPEPEDSVDATKIRNLLGLEDNGSIEDAVEQLIAEVTPLREAEKVHSEAKSFSDMFPEQAERMRKLEERDKNSRAKEFSESFLNIKDAEGKSTGKGLPPVAIEKIETFYKEFSENRATINDVADILQLVGGSGTIEYGERGSSTGHDVELDMSDGAKAFSDKIAEVMKEDELDAKSAAAVVAERFPELHNAYRSSLPGRKGNR